MNVRKKLKTAFITLSFIGGLTAFSVNGEEPVDAAAALPLENQAQNGTISQTQLNEEMSLDKGEINQEEANRQLIANERNNPDYSENQQADKTALAGKDNAQEQNRVKLDNNINLYEGEKGQIDQERSEIEPERTDVEEFRGGAGRR